ncbi:MAG: anaerobic ribonucleoside-triphosphate reductase activating protein [Candidatus Brocadiales bacterium]
MAIPIAGYIENSLIEWEGNIASIIFLPSCNLRCPYCHSPHLVHPSSKLETIPLENILSAIRRNKGWVDGVVITGGEPTLHKNLDELIGLFSPLGIKIRLDSNGTNPDVLEDLIMRKLIQCVAMDIKAPLREEKYEEAAGTPTNLSNIRRSIELIMNTGIEYEFRTTVCPTFLNESDIVEIARTIKGAQRYILQGFRPNNCLDKGMLDIVPYPVETLRQFAESAKEYVKNCFVRGEKKKELCRQW